MAHQVCESDPRTVAQRRADALGALAAGAEQLACACGATNCPAALDTDARAGAVVVHVIAESRSLECARSIHIRRARDATAHTRHHPVRGFGPRPRAARTR